MALRFRTLDFRTIDGSNNNLADSTMNQADTDFARVGPAHFANGFNEMTSGPNPREISSIVSDLTDQASALKEALYASAELLAQRNQLERSGDQAAAARIVVPEVDRAAALESLRGGSASFESVSAEMTANLYNLLAQAPSLPDLAGQKAFEQWKTRTRQYLAGLPAASEKLRTWSPDAPPGGSGAPV